MKVYKTREEFAREVVRIFVELVRDDTELVTKAHKITRPAIERAFDCAPLDDSLRGYVYTDMNDSQILGIVVQGE